MRKHLNILSLILIFILCSLVSLAQDKKEVINNIKEEIESIHLDTSLKIVTLQNEEFLENMTDGGGELTGFYNKNRIIRIYRSIGISNGVFISEFYYKPNKKGNLIFVREKFNSYVYDDSSKSFDYTKLNTTYYGRYYFNKGKLLDSVVTGVRTVSDNSGNIETILKRESEESYVLLTSKINSVKSSK